MANIDPNLCPDLYERLGVNHSASQQQIYDAYVKKYSQYNPANKTSNKDMWQRHFDEVQEAYRILGDVQARQRYDANLNALKNGSQVVAPNAAAQTGANLSNRNVTITVKEPIQWGYIVKPIIKGLVACGAVVALGTAIYHFVACENDFEFKNPFKGKHDDDKTITSDSKEQTEVSELEIYEFLDPTNESQLKKRIATVKQIFEQAGIKDYSEAEIERHILFINGEYFTKTEKEAYDVVNELLQRFAQFSTKTSDVVNFAGGVEEENSVYANAYMGAYLVDDTEHADIINEISKLHVKLFTAKTNSEIEAYSKEMFDIQAKLCLGLYIDKDGEEVGYANMPEAERFVVGAMFHQSATIITSALGKDYQITLEDGDETYTAKRAKVQEYYNPACVGKDPSETEWGTAYNGLVSASLAGKKQADDMKLIYTK